MLECVCCDETGPSPETTGGTLSQSGASATAGSPSTGTSIGLPASPSTARSMFRQFQDLLHDFSCDEFSVYLAFEHSFSLPM